MTFAVRLSELMTWWNIANYTCLQRNRLDCGRIVRYAARLWGLITWLNTVSYICLMHQVDCENNVICTCDNRIREILGQPLFSFFYHYPLTVKEWRLFAQYKAGSKWPNIASKSLFHEVCFYVTSEFSNLLVSYPSGMSAVKLARVHAILARRNTLAPVVVGSNPHPVDFFSEALISRQTKPTLP